MNDLGIIIPAYNEEDGIEEVLTRVKAACPTAMVLVVDDCSTDGTARIARQAGVETITNKVNCNYGKSLKIGFKHQVNNNRALFLAFLDADATYPPENIPELYKLCKEAEVDVAVGSRLMEKKNGMPPIRRLGNTLFAWLISAYSGKHITDTGSGLRVFKQHLLPMFEDLPDELSFTPAMTSKLAFQDIKYAEIPISYGRRVGKSKLSSVKDGWRFLTAILEAVKRYRPTCFYCTLGLPYLLVTQIIKLFKHIR